MWLFHDKLEETWTASRSFSIETSSTCDLLRLYDVCIKLFFFVMTRCLHLLALIVMNYIWQNLSKAEYGQKCHAFGRSGTQYVTTVNKTLKLVLWSTFSRILLQRIKRFWYKLAELSFFIIFDQTGWLYWRHHFVFAYLEKLNISGMPSFLAKSTEYRKLF